MNLETWGIKPTISDDDLSANREPGKSAKTTHNKKFGQQPAKQPLTLIKSKLELPVKEFFKIARKSFKIKAET